MPKLREMVREYDENRLRTAQNEVKILRRLLWEAECEIGQILALLDPLPPTEPSE